MLVTENNSDLITETTKDEILLESDAFIDFNNIDKRILISNMVIIDYLKQDGYVLLDGLGI